MPTPQQQRCAYRCAPGIFPNVFVAMQHDDGEESENKATQQERRKELSGIGGALHSMCDTCKTGCAACLVWCPQGDSNARTRLRRPVLYPLSYGGSRTGLGRVYHTPALASSRCAPSWRVRSGSLLFALPLASQEAESCRVLHPCVQAESGRRGQATWRPYGCLGAGTCRAVPIRCGRLALRMRAPCRGCNGAPQCAGVYRCHVAAPHVGFRRTAEGE
jgi:hypothetical protein